MRPQSLMNPEAAWQDGTFRTYLVILIGVLVNAGVVLALLTWGLRKDVRSIWVIYRSWLVMTTLALGAIFLGRVPTIIFFTALAVIAFNEFARATGLHKDRWMTGAVNLAILALGGSAIAPDPATGQPGWFGLFAAIPMIAVAAILLIPVVRNRADGQLQRMALSVLGFTCTGWLFLHLAFLADAPGRYGYLMYLVFAVQLSDIAAFIFGRWLGRSGRRPLRSLISPNKTWEGAAGALVVSLALPWVMWFSFPHFRPAQLVLTGLIVGIGGQLGDLSMSVIKRDLGIKDMGAIIAGHGGVLDRIDSLLFTAPLFTHMVNHYFRLW